MAQKLKNIILWIFGRQLFYKLLQKDFKANFYLQLGSEDLSMNMLVGSTFSTDLFGSDAHEDKINKMVDSKILLEMLRIFDFNARFFVQSLFSSNTLGINTGENHAICFFKKLTSRMNSFLTVSVGCRKESIKKWNLRGQLKFSFKNLKIYAL